MRDDGKPYEPMSPKHAKRVIDVAYDSLERACESNTDARRMFRDSYKAALEQERGHRRMGRGMNPNPYRVSVETAARYFVLKWFLFPARIDNALDAVIVSTNCLHSSALRLQLGKVPVSPAMTDVQFIDYREHLGQPV